MSRKNLEKVDVLFLSNKVDKITPLKAAPMKAKMAGRQLAKALGTDHNEMVVVPVTQAGNYKVKLLVMGDFNGSGTGDDQSNDPEKLHPQVAQMLNNSRGVTGLGYSASDDRVKTMREEITQGNVTVIQNVGLNLKNAIPDMVEAAMANLVTRAAADAAANADQAEVGEERQADLGDESEYESIDSADDSTDEEKQAAVAPGEDAANAPANDANRQRQVSPADRKAAVEEAKVEGTNRSSGRRSPGGDLG